MCWVIPPASPDWTLARRILSSRLVFPWSTWPITVTTGGFTTRSSGSSSGATSTGSGSSTEPISTCTSSSSATSSISSVESVWVRVFISPRPIKTLMIWVGGTPKASPRSLTLAPGSTRTPTPLCGSSSSTGARSGSLGAEGAVAGRTPRFLALASMTTRRRFFCGRPDCGTETGSSAGAWAMVALWPDCSASARASWASGSWASVRPFGALPPPNTLSYTFWSTDEEWLFTSTPASCRRCITSLLSSDCSRAISYTLLLIGSPTLYHSLELGGLRLMRRDAAEERPWERHVGAPAAVGENRPAAVHRGVLVGLPVLFLFLVLRRLALWFYVYLPVRQLHGEAGVLALAPDRQRELVVRYNHLGLLLVFIKVDLAHPRRAQSLGYKPGGLGIPLDDVYLLVPKLGDYRPHAAPARTHTRPDRVDPRFLGPHGHLRAQASLAGYGPDLDEPVVDLRHFQLEEVSEQSLVTPAHRQARAAASLPDLQQIHLEALAVLVALVWYLLTRGQYGLDPSKIDQRHPPVGLLYDTGHDVTHALAVLVQQLLVVYLVQALVESLAHYLGGYAREVVRGYVLAVLHDPEVARILIENDPCVFVGPLTTLVSGEKRLLQHALHRCERDALVRLYLVQR